ncbi:MAG: hypothetical protein QHJ82_03630 [Verrucomicrobiota bacterium]|nr:hypothetical protein [Verrucomicrobiota bacterium]
MAEGMLEMICVAVESRLEVLPLRPWEAVGSGGCVIAVACEPGIVKRKTGSVILGALFVPCEIEDFFRGVVEERIEFALPVDAWNF